jgi:hypothetical protein
MVKIFFDESHNERIRLDKIEKTIALFTNGINFFSIKTKPIRLDILKGCDILIIGNPFGDQEAFTAVEVKDVTRFVEEGGKVIIAIGCGVTRDSGFANLLKNFGVIDYKGFIINEKLEITWQSTHPLLRNVEELGASGGYTVEPKVEVIVNRVRKDTTKYRQYASESVKLVKTYEIITPILVSSKLGKGVFIGTGEINFTKPYPQFLKNLFQYLINFDKIKENENEPHFFCPMCGICLPSSARFCPQCGTALDRIRR